MHYQESTDRQKPATDELRPEQNRSVRILIADDHEVMRMGMCNLLEAVPHWEVCAEARDGREAVELAIRNPPDIVILDITMPELNGFEVAAQIEKRLPQVPVIMFSLHVTADVIDRFNRGTVRGAVAKSEAARDLIKAVRAVLEGGTFFRTLPTK